MYVEILNIAKFQVFAASNVELVTRTRMEHLTAEDKQKSNSTPKSPIQSFLTIAETQEKPNIVAPEGVCIQISKLN